MKNPSPALSVCRSAAHRINPWIITLCLALAPAQASVLVEASAFASGFDYATFAHVRNGVAQPGYVQSGGSVVALGPFGPGATNAEASVLQNSFYGNAGASATADLATGKLGAGATNSAVNVGGYPQSIGFGRFGDRLTFVNSGPNPVQLGINWDVNGTVLNQTGTGLWLIDVILQFGAPGISPNSLGLLGAPYGSDSLTYRNQNAGLSISGSHSSNYLNPNPIWNVSGTGLNRVMEAVWVLLPGTTIVDFTASISVLCQGGMLCDYTHTAGFTFDALPSGLSWSSESGVFLSNPGTPGEVPEPATATMFLVGALLVAGMRRAAQRKRS